MLPNDKVKAAVEVATDEINRLLEKKEYIIVAIDGCCAAGKSTFAAMLQKKTKCNLFHMDDFFLRLEQRTEARLKSPGENVDHERFLEEVLLSIQKRTPFVYKPYDCHTQSFKESVEVLLNRIYVVEGSYSCNNSLWDKYDLHIFLEVTPTVQRDRILKRNGASELLTFEQKWIPLENQYFTAFDIAKRCELYFEL